MIDDTIATCVRYFSCLLSTALLPKTKFRMSFFSLYKTYKIPKKKKKTNTE